MPLNPEGRNDIEGRKVEQPNNSKFDNDRLSEGDLLGVSGSAINLREHKFVPLLIRRLRPGHVRKKQE